MGRKNASGISEAPKPGYSFADVLALTSATHSNLVHWRTRKIITPGAAAPGGSGHHSRYSALNVIEVQLAKAINSFRVPADTIYAAIDEFRYFHHGMVAVYEEGARLPAAVNPPWWSSPEQRDSFARSYVMSHARRFSKADGPWPTQAEVDVALQEVEKMAKLWDDLLTGPAMRGDESSRLSQLYSSADDFLGLFMTGFDFDSVGEAFYVALNPTNLSRVVKDGAIVIDLVNVIWEVGKRCKRLSCTLGPWHVVEQT